MAVRRSGIDPTLVTAIGGLGGRAPRVCDLDGHRNVRVSPRLSGRWTGRRDLDNRVAAPPLTKTRFPTCLSGVRERAPHRSLRRWGACYRNRAA